MPDSNNDLSSRQLRLLWLLLVIFVALCHWEWLTSGLPIKGADISTYYLPFYNEYIRHFAAGRFPLWTNSVFSGHPIVAEGQVSLLHPLMHLLLRFCEHRAEAIFLVAHALIAATGMYRYARALGSSRYAATLGALALSTSGFFAVRTIQPNYYGALAYLPWQLLLVERLLPRGASPAWAAPLAAASALQWLCGHPQIPVFSSYLLGFYAFLRVLGRIGADERSEANYAALVKIGGALVAGLMLASVQLIPLALDVVRAQSERAGGVQASFSAFGSLPPWALLLPLLPALYGHNDLNVDVPYWPAMAGGKVASWETHIYFGAALLVLAVLAAWKLRRQPRTRTLALLGLLCVLYALGKFSPVFWVLHYLPGLNLLRVPSRAVGPLLVFLIALSALGLDWLRSGGEQSRRAWQRALRVGLFTGAAFWIVLAVGVRLAGPIALEKGVARSVAVEQAKLDQREHVHPATRERRLAYAAERPAAALEQIRQSTAIGPRLLSNFAFLALVGLLIGIWARAAGNERFFRVSLALFMLCGVELLWFNREFGAHATEVEQPFAPPAYKDALPPGKFFSALSAREVLGHGWEALRRRGPALASLIWDLPTPDGRTSMQPAQYTAMIEPLRGFDRSGAERLELISAGLPKLRLLGVTSVLTLSPWGKLDLPLLYEDTDVRVWQLPDPAPQAFITNAQGIDDAEGWRALMALEHPGDDARARYEAVLAGRFGSVESGSTEDPDYQRLQLDSPREAWLVRIVRDMPGWSVSVNGEEASITTLLGHFQGVRIPAGRSEVVFRYEPPSFALGARISALTALTLLGLLLWSWRRAAASPASAS